MLQQSKARIFLSAERQVFQTEKYRSHSSLMAGEYREKNDTGAIVSFEEVTLAAAENTTIYSSEDVCYVIIPLVGTLHFEHAEDDNLVNPGQTLFISSTTIITNPYPDQLVNFLQICCRRRMQIKDTVSSFDIDRSKNNLIIIAEGEDLPKISIGKFDGRKEMLQPLESKEHGVFIHVIAGAFEVQYRLLEAKDSLFIWNTDSLDLEALSNEAIILLIETPLTAQEV